jgi:hypothetical protein
MTQADSVHSTPPTNTSAPLAEVADGLAELEAPMLRIRGLIYATRMMASSVELSKEATDALDAITLTTMDEIDAVVEERTRLWHLANGREGGSDAEV